MHVPDGSPMLRALFVALTLSLGLLFIVAVSRSSGRRAAVIAAILTAMWIAGTGLAAARGLLHFSPPPPTIAIVLVATLVTSIGVGLSAVGRRMVLAIPLAALVGFQGFRVGVELLLHRAYLEGLMPVQMSYSGRNFDIVAGATAILLAAWLASGRRSRALVIAWNVLGIALLANILVVAMLSAPTPLRVFMNEPANVWIERAPWIWLPAVMVWAAIYGHVLVTRAILAGRT